MKKYVMFLIASICFNVSYSQVLFTENFNSYPVGNFNTNFTGQTPTKTGWYTLDRNSPNFPGSDNADYQIVSEPNRGNILHLGYTNRIEGNAHQVYRTDINSFWQQRTVGNNVFKISFDIFTQDANDMTGQFYLENNDTPKLFRLYYHGEQKRLVINVPFARGNGASSPQHLKYSNGSYVILPVNTWVTVEVYIDYNNSTISVSLPTMNNYTATYTIPYALQLRGVDIEGNPLPDDSPVKFLFFGENGINIDPQKNNPFRLRVDNINFAAQNKVPTENLAVNDQLAQKFNLFPNPATNVVNITNNENMLVNQVTVYDIAGKELKNQTFTNENQVQLNVENLASGTYMLHLQTTAGMAVKKLIKK